MKTYLALISSAALAALSVVSAVEPLHKYPEFSGNSTINIPDDFTPFGYNSQFSRFGDDGSKCLLDTSGVLTWIDSAGVARVLPDTTLGSPLIVTNSECLVWSNRFEDYGSYPSRAEAILTLFRADPSGTSVTSTRVSAFGKEITDTSPVTTTSGAMVFVNTRRNDDGKETQVGSTLYNFSDGGDFRFYRLTFDGQVQLVTNLTLRLKAVPDFDTNLSGPLARTKGFGSDGSIVVGIDDVWVSQTSVVDAVIENRVYWLDGIGRMQRVDDVDRVIYCSNTRLIYAERTGGLMERRRSSASGTLIGATPTPLLITGAVVDLSNYSRIGNLKYLYTIDADNVTLRTYSLVGAQPLLQTTTALPTPISGSARISTFNPSDGSALLIDEDSSTLIWLHAGGHNLIGSGAGPSAIYVTNEQAVVWENGRAPIGDDGLPPAAVVNHYARDTTTNALTATNVAVQGRTVLNPLPYTPSFPYWSLNVAEKTAADTTLLRSYSLVSVFIADRDGDGLLDSYETNTGVYVSPTDTGSDPRSSDSDGDGLSDYDEVYVYDTDPNNTDSDGDGVGDSDEVDSYLTDPTQVDTDLDGISDYDEIFVLHTDPNVKSFGETPDPTDNVDFGSTSVNGDYEGLVYDPVSGFSFKQTLRLSSKGAFTGSLKGLLSDSSYRGQFLDTGLYVGPVTAQGVTSVQMVVAPNASGNYIVSGSYQTVSGGTAYFELKRSLYSKTNRYTGPSKVTLEAMLALSASGPQGSAVGTGTISTSGQVSFSLYMPDGGKQSFSGPLLEGDTIALFSKRSSGNRPVLLGSLKIVDMPGESDFNGSVRLFGANSSSSSMFPTGYDQDRQLLGAYYYPPAKGTMPLSSFLPTSNNAVFRWLSGNFAGVTKVGTWATNASVQVPKTQFDSAKVSFKASTGLMSISYTRTDANLELFKSKSTGHAVVLQKNGTVNGYYVSARSAGSFGVTANSGNLQPEIASISPKSKTMAAAGGSYAVTVTAVGAWRVEVPSTVNWVSVTTTSQTGAGVLTGSGNGTVIVTVRASSSMTRDEVELKIAGIGHTITRDFR